MAHLPVVVVCHLGPEKPERYPISRNQATRRGATLRRGLGRSVGPLGRCEQVADVAPQRHRQPRQRADAQVGVSPLDPRKSRRRDACRRRERVHAQAVRGADARHVGRNEIRGTDLRSNDRRQRILGFEFLEEIVTAHFSFLT